jgi:hypothetical protein
MMQIDGHVRLYALSVRAMYTPDESTTMSLFSSSSTGIYIER